MGKLSIYIPTWNRQHLLDRLLGTIQPQLVDDVDVFVSVNKSPEPYALPDWVNSRTTRTNVGGDANIGVGPTLVTGDYVWVIGDDEQLLPNAITDTLAAIKHQPGLIIHPSLKHDTSAINGRTFPNYAAFCETAISNNLGWIIAAHTLISSNTFLRAEYDLKLAYQLIDTRYGFHYGMLSNILWKPVTVLPEPTMIYGREASVFQHSPEVIREHMAMYPRVVYEIFGWIYAMTGYPIPPSCWKHGFDV